MDAATRHLSRCKQSRDGSRAVQVRPYAAHHVMGAGRHGNPLLGNVDVGTQACSVDRRKPSLDEFGAKMRDIQVNVPGFCGGHLGPDCTRYNVTWSESS